MLIVESELAGWLESTASMLAVSKSLTAACSSHLMMVLLSFISENPLLVAEVRFADCGEKSLRTEVPNKQRCLFIFDSNVDGDD